MTGEGEASEPSLYNCLRGSVHQEDLHHARDPTAKALFRKEWEMLGGKRSGGKLPKYPKTTNSFRKSSGLQSSDAFGLSTKFRRWAPRIMSAGAT